jgi:L-lactate dehydrogenase complex protein LldG
VDIDLPKMLTRVRAGQGTGVKGKAGEGLSLMAKTALKIYSRIARSPKLFTAAQKFAGLGSRLLAPSSAWIRLPAVTGWGYSKDFPRFAAKTFRERYKDTRRQANKDTGNRHKIDQGQQKETLPGEELSVEDLTSRFTSELSAIGGQVHQAGNGTEAIIEFLNSRGIWKIHLEPNVLDESLLQQAGIDFTHEPDPEILVGVTKAVCGLADSGSILETEGPGYPLHASLLPQIHIAVLNRSEILPTMKNAMTLVREKDVSIFITGPSRTADIEMSLTIGVHGPSEVHIFLT